MIRMFDYDCPNHGVFEVMITTETVPTFFGCGKCGEIGPRVWRKFNGMQPKDSVHAIEFGGRTFLRDDVEEVLTNKNETPPMSEAKREELHDRFSRAAYREMHGYVDAAPEETPKLDEVASSTLANVKVDPDLATAHADKLVETMKT